MSILVVTEPWAELDHERDTSLRLVQEMVARGHEVHWTPVTGIAATSGEVVCASHRIASGGSARSVNDWSLERPDVRNVVEFQRIFYRADAPVDARYIHPLQLLAVAARQRPCRAEFINPIAALLQTNEKLETLLFPGHSPTSLVSSDRAQLLDFAGLFGRVVAKPLDQMACAGVQLLDCGNLRRTTTILDEMTNGFRRPILLQEFLREVGDGETRLWFVDGHLLAHAVKRPAAGEWRASVDHGARVEWRPLNRAEEEVAVLVGTHLRRSGIRMAAVDTISGLVIDFNALSPGMIVELEQATGRNLSNELLDRILPRDADDKISA